MKNPLKKMEVEGSYQKVGTQGKPHEEARVVLRPERNRSQVCDELGERMYQKARLVNAKSGTFEGQ